MKADKAIKAQFVETKANDAGEEVFYFQATVGTKDREGEIVTVDGWVFDNFLKNPVFMTFHNYETWPVGKVVSIEPNAMGFIIGVVFDDEDAEAVKVKRKYERGFLNCVSVGFIRIETTGKRVGKDWVTTKKELLEVSAVPIPAHPDATMIRKDIDGMEERVGTKAVDFNTALALDQARNNLWDRKWTIERALEKANDSVVADAELDHAAKIAAIASNYDAFAQAMLGWYGDYINVKVLAEAAGVKMVQPDKPSEPGAQPEPTAEPSGQPVEGGGEVGEKAGRTISKKNTDVIKAVIDGLTDSAAKLQAVLGEPSADEEDDDTKSKGSDNNAESDAAKGAPELAINEDTLSALKAFVGNKEDNQDA